MIITDSDNRNLLNHIETANDMARARKTGREVDFAVYLDLEGLLHFGAIRLGEQDDTGPILPKLISEMGLMFASENIMVIAPVIIFHVHPAGRSKTGFYPTFDDFWAAVEFSRFFYEYQRGLAREFQAYGIEKQVPFVFPRFLISNGRMGVFAFWLSGPLGRLRKIRGYLGKYKKQVRTIIKQEHPKGQCSKEALRLFVNVGFAEGRKQFLEMVEYRIWRRCNFAAGKPTDMVPSLIPKDEAH